MVRTYAFLARSLHLGLIITLLAQGHWFSALFNAGVFVGTVYIFFLGGKDREYYAIDAGFALLFSAAIILDLVGLPLDSSILGPDKAFHAIAGSLLAWFGFRASQHVPVLRLLKARPYLAAWTVLLTVGLAWEAYEWILHAFVADMGLTHIDTVLDVVADSLGAGVALLVTRPKKTI